MSIYVGSAVSVSSGCLGFIYGVPSKERHKEELLILTTIPVSVIQFVSVKRASVWNCLRVNVLPNKPESLTCIIQHDIDHAGTHRLCCLTDIETFLASCPRGPLAVSDKMLTLCCMNVLNIYNQRQMVLRVSVLYIDLNTWWLMCEWSIHALTMTNAWCTYWWCIYLTSNL